MSKQRWTTKLAQALVPGDLIPNQGKTPRALEVSAVKEMGGKLHVKCYQDLYRSLSPQVFVMEKSQRVPVATSGVKHMDEITTFDISQ